MKTKQRLHDPSGGCITTAELAELGEWVRRELDRREEVLERDGMRLRRGSGS